MSDDTGGGYGPAEELAHMREVLGRPMMPAFVLRLWLAQGRLLAWVWPATRRDERLQQRLALLRTLLRERRGS